MSLSNRCWGCHVVTHQDVTTPGALQVADSLVCQGFGAIFIIVLET